MDQIKDGGRAFPSNRSAQFGMSLRDYFAAKAMEGLLAGGFSDAICTSMVAYEYADAMLAEREKERE